MIAQFDIDRMDAEEFSTFLAEGDDFEDELGPDLTHEEVLFALTLLDF